MTNHVLILSSDSYAELLITVQKWYETDGAFVNVVDGHYLSDRFSKKVYYFLVYNDKSPGYELG